MKLKKSHIALKRKGINVIQFLPLLFIFSDACIEPLAVDLPRMAPKLVVDGLITDAPGPYQVTLLYTTSIDSTLRRPRYETGATLSIIDNEGQSEPLYE